MPMLPVYDWLGLDLSRRTEWAINATAIALVTFMVLNFQIVQSMLFGVDPGPMYWIVKPLFVGVPALVISWYAYKRAYIHRLGSLTLGLLAGVAALSVYHSFVATGSGLVLGTITGFLQYTLVNFGLAAVAVGAVYVVYRYAK